MSDLTTLENALNGNRPEEFRREFGRLVQEAKKGSFNNAYITQLETFLSKVAQFPGWIPRQLQEQFMRDLSSLKKKTKAKTFSFGQKGARKAAEQAAPQAGFTLMQSSEPVSLVDWTCKDMKGQTVYIDEADKKVSVTDLEDCQIYVLQQVPVCSLFNMKNCVFIAKSITSSISITNCHNCKFVLGGKQLRIHQTTNTDFYIAFSSVPIIENCTAIRFGPIENDQTENWNTISDFNHPEETGQITQNWRLIPESERTIPMIPPQ